jgi:ABC-type multidrug transport system fused ATPase/permease subunit
MGRFLLRLVLGYWLAFFAVILFLIFQNTVEMFAEPFVKFFTRSFSEDQQELFEVLAVLLIAVWAFRSLWDLTGWITKDRPNHTKKVITSAIPDSKSDDLSIETATGYGGG